MTTKSSKTSAERERIDELSEWYLDGQLALDKRMIRHRYEAIRGHLVPGEGLELGAAEGVMTRLLLPHFRRLTVVEASKDLLGHVPAAPNLVKVNCLFEEFDPACRFDSIVMEHILEHVDQPQPLLQRVSGWVGAGGRIIVGVPNARSIHRLVAVKMGLLKSEFDLGPRDHDLGHRRVYCLDSLRETLDAAGLRIVATGGVFLKPLTYQQIEENWTEEMIRGFLELGKDFPALAADIFAVCEPR